jgi:hypothetical protein
MPVPISPAPAAAPDDAPAGFPTVAPPRTPDWRPPPSWDTPPVWRAPQGRRPSTQLPSIGWPSAAAWQRFLHGGQRWPWLVLTLVLQALLCGGALFAVNSPYADQYPSSVEVNSQVPGLIRVSDPARQQLAQRLLAKLQSDSLDEQGFVALYADAANRQRQVTLFGTTRLISSPSRDLDNTMQQLVGDLQLAEVRAFEPGPMGGDQRCAQGRLDGRAITVCGWADHGSLAIGMFTGRTDVEGAAMLQTVRARVLRRG